MNDTYAAYLQSEAWAEKRIKAIHRAGGRCAACGSSSKIQIHHLTYARVFREEYGDLVALCEIHHEAAEEMIRKGVVCRSGDTAELLKQTLRFIAPSKKVFTPPAAPRKEPEYPTMNSMLHLEYNEFLMRVSHMFRGKPFAKKKIRHSINEWRKAHPNRKATRNIAKKVKAKRGKIDPLPVSPDLESLKRSIKGWTREKLASYGIPWPPPRGWRKQLLGIAKFPVE